MVKGYPKVLPKPIKPLKEHTLLQASELNKADVWIWDNYYDVMDGLIGDWLGPQKESAWVGGGDFQSCLGSIRALIATAEWVLKFLKVPYQGSST